MFSLIFGGCVAYDVPGDLDLLSVQAVDWRDQKEMAGPGSSPLRGLVPPREIERLGESVMGGEKPPRPLLKIEFMSGMNLGRFANANSYPVGSFAHFCRRPEDKTRLGFVTVFWQGYEVDRLVDSPLLIESAGPFVYYTHIDVAGQDFPGDIPPRKAFDLRKLPEDVCIQLRGGNGPWGYRSSTLVVPKEAIATALRKGRWAE
jgi:hypothetical protein